MIEVMGNPNEEEVAAVVAALRERDVPPRATAPRDEYARWREIRRHSRRVATSDIEWRV